MVAEIHDLPNGWPLGLENINMRFQVVNSSNSSRVAMTAPFWCHGSASFSSFTSSDLDTKSTGSFFQDRSISLGCLLRIRPDDGENFKFIDSICHKEHQVADIRSKSSNLRGGSHEVVEVSQGTCIPLLQSVLVKIGSSRSNLSR